MHTHHRGDAMLYIHPVAGSFFSPASPADQLGCRDTDRCAAKKKLKNPNLFFFVLCLSFSQFAAQTLHASGSAANQ